MFGVVETMRTWDCYNCIYLDKSRKQKSKNVTVCFRYGCNARLKDSYICGWIREDSELKTMGCSDSNKIKVGTAFLLDGVHCLYCGSIGSGAGKRYLLYNASTYVSNGYCVDNVKEDWFQKNLKKIQILKQTEEQLNRNRKCAKLYKRRYIEIEEETLPFC